MTRSLKPYAMQINTWATSRGQSNVRGPCCHIQSNVLVPRLAHVSFFDSFCLARPCLSSGQWTGVRFRAMHSCFEHPATLRSANRSSPTIDRRPASAPRAVCPVPRATAVVQPQFRQRCEQTRQHDGLVSCQNDVTMRAPTLKAANIIISVPHSVIRAKRSITLHKRWLCPCVPTSYSEQRRLFESEQPLPFLLRNTGDDGPTAWRSQDASSWSRRPKTQKTKETAAHCKRTCHGRPETIFHRAALQRPVASVGPPLSSQVVRGCVSDPADRSAALGDSALGGDAKARGSLGDLPNNLQRTLPQLCWEKQQLCCKMPVQRIRAKNNRKASVHSWAPSKVRPPKAHEEINEVNNVPVERREAITRP